MDSESFYLVMAKKRPERCSCIPARYVMTFLIFCGLFVVYVLRVNLCVAIVAMVNNSAIADPTKEAPRTCVAADIGNGNMSLNVSNAPKYEFEKDGEFIWDSKIQSLILGGFYYGYCLTQLPGGWIAEKFGGKWAFGIGILMTSFFSVLTPIAARAGVAVVVLIRMAKGIGEGVTYPAMYALFSRWAPLKERSLLIALASVGANLGTILGMPATALLSEHGFDGGWPSAFYVCGALGFLWFVPWAVIAASRPTRHPRITDHELIYLKHALGPLKKRPPTPWKSILTSGPVWAVTVARFAGYYGLFTLLSELPNYLKNELGYTMDENGAVNAVIYTSQSIGMIAGGYFSDLLRTRSSLPLNVNRKIFESIGCIGPAICLLAVPFCGCNRTLIVALITLGQGFYGFNAGGSIPAMVDLAPDLAGTVSGIVLTIASFAGFTAPLVAGRIVQEGLGLQSWNKVFFVICGVYVVGAVVFILFGSSEIQPWGRPLSEFDNIATPPIRPPHRASRLSVISRTSSVASRYKPYTVNDLDGKIRALTISEIPLRRASADPINTSLEEFVQYSHS